MLAEWPKGLAFYCSDMTTIVGGLCICRFSVHAEIILKTLLAGHSRQTQGPPMSPRRSDGDLAQMNRGGGGEAVAAMVGEEKSVCICTTHHTADDDLGLGNSVSHTYIHTYPLVFV